MLKAAIWVLPPPESRLQNDRPVEPIRIKVPMNMCLFEAFGAWSSRTYRMNYLFVLGTVWGLRVTGLALELPMDLKFTTTT